MKHSGPRGATVTANNATGRYAMTETPSQSRTRTGALLVAGSVLVATGGILGLLGLGLGTVALVTAARRRVGQMEIPPSEFARTQFARARAATSAGVGAWRSQPTPDGVESRRNALAGV